MVSNSWQQKSQRHISYGPTEVKLYARRNMLNGVYLDLKLVGFRISIGLVWKMLCITITSTILCDAKWEKIRRAALWCGDVAQTRAECNTGILSAQLWVQQTTCFWSKATPALLTLPCVWTFRARPCNCLMRPQTSRVNAPEMQSHPHMDARICRNQSCLGATLPLSSHP